MTTNTNMYHYFNTGALTGTFFLDDSVEQFDQKAF